MFTMCAPIITYHQITAETPPAKLEFAVSIDQFKRQMRYLHDNAFTCISIADLLKNSGDDQIFRKKTFALTFDDGYENFYSLVYPILRGYGFTATIFIITDKTYSQNDPKRELDKRYLTCEQIRCLQENNFSIGSHTCSHARLPDLPRKEIQRELLQSKIYLERELNQKIEWLAYPHGISNSEVQKIAEEVGYQAAFGGSRGRTNQFDIRRQFCQRNDSLLAFALKLNRLFHRFENFKNNTEIGQFLRKARHSIRFMEMGR